MKWPEYVAIIRHDFSAYNALKEVKRTSKTYQTFQGFFKKDPDSEESRYWARKAWAEISLNVGDHDTPLANDGVQAKVVGEALKDQIELPDVIFVSPYDRTKHTLKQIMAGWPELKSVPVFEEERLREQEHGLGILYNDKDILHALHPEQRILQQIEGRYWYRHPQGENVPDVRERVRSWTNTLVREWAGKKVLAISHHLTILSVRANFERLGAEEFIAMDENEKPLNAGVTLYSGNPKSGKNGRLELEYYNRKFY